MADTQDWSSNANEAINIVFRQTAKGAAKKSASFHPSFTYPIFGDEESIFGYQGLAVGLEFTADRLVPKLEISYDRIFNSIGDTKPDEVEKALMEVLPSLALSEKPTESAEAFEPPGKLVHEYEIDNRRFGIWCASLSDQATKELLRDAQSLILFFIEGGSRIELDDEPWTLQRWKVFFLYAIDTISDSPDTPIYSLVGYSTSYRAHFLDVDSSSDSITAQSPSEVPDLWTLLTSLPARPRISARERISQFLILPPYQSKGHGSHLYNAMISRFTNDPTVKEIPVEDPNESFDDMRDMNDLLRLRQDTDFAQLKIDHSVKIPNKNEEVPLSKFLPTETLANIRLRHKIPSRQFARLTEMQLLSQIPAYHRQVARITRKDKASDDNDRAYYFWRLIVKDRLYEHNIESLLDLEPSERVEKLDEAVGAVEPDYVRLLSLTDGRAFQSVGRSKQTNGDTGAEQNGSRNSRGKGKRKRVLDEDEDEGDNDQDDDNDDDEEEEEEEAGQAGAEEGEEIEAESNEGEQESRELRKKRMKVTFKE